VQTNETQRNGPAPAVCNESTHHRAGTYQKALDGRKRPIRGLWQRNRKFYARISVEDPGTGRKQVRRVPLAADTVAQAQAELRRLMTKREENALPILKLTPKFRDYAAQYLAYYKTVKDAKRPKTLQTESGHLDMWIKHLGDTRLDKINRAMINAFIAKRQGQGRSGRTVNLGIVVLRNVLKKAVDDGWIVTLPTVNLRPLKWTPRKRELFSAKEIDMICQAAIKESRNGVEFADYIRLMAYCGARMSETLRLKWSDVDWKQRQLTIGSDGLAKNHRSRIVDFNVNMKAHLREMLQRKAPESEWLFPSPQRGNVDRAAKTFRETLLIARKVAGLPSFGFHDCRHHFASMCVMAGIDFMTIARWLGHQDGGILIGKVYGHLSNEHAQRQAEKLVFLPTAMEDADAPEHANVDDRH
jgi:integrase